MNLQEKAEMKQAIVLAVISVLVLAGFLWFRPLVATIGKSGALDTKGRASQPIPAGALTPTAALIPATTPTSSPVTSSAAKPRPSSTDAAQAGISHVEEVERLVFEMVNTERQKANLKPLTQDGMLRDVARGHSDDMLFRGFFDHIDPDGLNQAGRIALQHRRLISRSSGENIIKLTGYDASDARNLANEIMNGKQGWMNSPPHKKNILTGDFTHIGIGLSLQGKEIRATQVFAQTIAYTDQPVLPQLAQGSQFNASATDISGTGVKANQFDYWDPSKGVRVGEIHQISDGVINVGKGVYKLRFYFPDGKAYLGPQIEVY
jgi:uncharacterized protein YkwD